MLYTPHVRRRSREKSTFWQKSFFVVERLDLSYGFLDALNGIRQRRTGVVFRSSLFVVVLFLSACTVRPTALFVEDPDLLEGTVVERPRTASSDEIIPIVPLWQEERPLVQGTIGIASLPSGEQPIGRLGQAVILWFVDDDCGRVCQGQRALLQNLSESRVVAAAIIWEVDRAVHPDLWTLYKVDRSGTMIGIDLEGKQVGRMEEVVDVNQMTDFLWSHE